MGTWLSKIFKFGQPLTAYIKLNKSSFLIQISLEFFSSWFHIKIIFTIKQNISFSIHDSSSFNFGHIRVIILVPFLIYVIQGISSVMSTASTSMMTNHTNQIIFDFFRYTI